MTDNEIVKAVKSYEEKILANGIKSLEPFEVREIVERQQEEINRQKAEIERLKDALTDHEYANCVAIKNGLIYTHTLEDYERLIGDISAEAYKECIEKVKKKGVKVGVDEICIFEGTLDNLLIEMESDNNA